MNISLIPLIPSFATCVGKAGQLDSVLDGIQSAINANFNLLKLILFYPVIGLMMKLNALLQYVKLGPLIWRFIEYMPFQGDAFHGPTFDEWKDQLERVSGGILTEVHRVYGFGPATYLEFTEW